MHLNRLHRLVKMAPDAIKTKFYRRGEFDDWADPTNRVILLGEAAHPIMVRSPLFSGVKKKIY